MKKSLVFIAVLLFVCVGAMAGPQRDVLAHASGNWSWFAQVKIATPMTTGEAMTGGEETLLFARENGPGQQWRPLPSLSGRAVALAARSSQLAALMSDGQWLTVWADGSSTGQPLPAGGRIKTIADDGTDLWALGEVSGGIAAAKADLEKQSATTRPTTEAVQPIAAATTEPSELHLTEKLVLFRQLNGLWAAVSEMPGDPIVLSSEDVSLAIVGSTPIVSFTTFNNAVRTTRFDPQHGWTYIGRTPEQPTTGSFRILSDGFKPLLWWTGGNDAGEIFRDASAALPSPLKWNGPDKPDGIPTAIFSGGYLCVFAPHAGKVFEQRYKIDGTPIETAAELTVPRDFNDSGIPHWLESVFLCSLGFTVGSSVFRQWSESSEKEAVPTLTPAPLLPRLAAGVIDALPVIAAVVYLFAKATALGDLIEVPSWPSVIIFASAFLVYLLHTTLAELYTARSAGKWVFGLKVVTVEGTSPTQSQILIRNLLRIIDPLVMIVISPLGQRSADTVAGTVVVGMDAIPPETETATDNIPLEIAPEAPAENVDAE